MRSPDQQVRYPPSKPPVVQPWTCRGGGKDYKYIHTCIYNLWWREITDWADTLADKTTATSGLHLRWSGVLRSLNETPPADKRPWYERHIINNLEERGAERESTRRSSVLDRTKKYLRQLDEQKNYFKGKVGETPKRRDGAYMGFSEHIDSILNWTETLHASSHALLRHWWSSCFLFLYLWAGRRAADGMSVKRLSGLLCVYTSSAQRPLLFWHKKSLHSTR